MTCPRCGSEQTTIVEGKGPHHARENCADCGRWLRWVTRPSNAVRPAKPPSSDSDHEPGDEKEAD